MRLGSIESESVRSRVRIVVCTINFRVNVSVSGW